ncbi:translation initiation factor IF-2 [Manacus candei]|uniref:translation initiation factor IF-2 n=1 Tax=Manacus candei TaxID=415023 RepID=UPI00222792A0|nr:translation initiation factor IF-2 [Manacus candei]
MRRQRSGTGPASASGAAAGVSPCRPSSSCSGSAERSHPPLASPRPPSRAGTAGLGKSARRVPPARPRPPRPRGATPKERDRLTHGSAAGEAGDTSGFRGAGEVNCTEVQVVFSPIRSGRLKEGERGGGGGGGGGRVSLARSLSRTHTHTHTGTRMHSHTHTHTHTRTRTRPLGSASELPQQGGARTENTRAARYRRGAALPLACVSVRCACACVCICVCVCVCARVPPARCLAQPLRAGRCALPPGRGRRCRRGSAAAGGRSDWGRGTASPAPPLGSAPAASCLRGGGGEVGGGRTEQRLERGGGVCLFVCARRLLLSSGSRPRVAVGLTWWKSRGVRACERPSLPPPLPRRRATRVGTLRRPRIAFPRHRAPGPLSALLGPRFPPSVHVSPTPLFPDLPPRRYSQRPGGCPFRAGSAPRPPAI